MALLSLNYFIIIYILDKLIKKTLSNILLVLCSFSKTDIGEKNVTKNHNSISNFSISFTYNIDQQGQAIKTPIAPE